MTLTADQASFMLHTLGLPALQNEHRITSAVIAAIPTERAHYRPHGDSRGAFDLAWHIVSAEIKYLNAIAAGVFPHDLQPLPDDIQMPSDLVAWYAGRFDPAVKRLQMTSGDELLREVDFYGRRTMPAIMLLPIILNHTIHHRGQYWVLFRREICGSFQLWYWMTRSSHRTSGRTARAVTGKRRTRVQA